MPDKFILPSEFQPTGDQPQAIDKLVRGIEDGDRAQTLLGVLFLLLQGVGALVKRQHEQVHEQAQHDDGRAGVRDYAVGQRVDDLKKKLKGLEKQGVQ